LNEKAPAVDLVQIISSKHFGFDLDILFASLDAERHLLVAVSGGSDSVALLHLLHDWSSARGGPLLTVATIDHGLRIESANEARLVGDLTEKLGLKHIIRTWEGEKPASGLSQKAREARYALLSSIALEIGASAIALGHTRDDQRETVLMRAKRLGFSEFDAAPDRSTSHGLAGMRPRVSYCGPPDFKPVVLVRPVLRIARAKLRLFLERMGAGWVDDPSNEDAHYERIRLRQELVAHPTTYPSAGQICRFANQVAIQRQEQVLQCASFMINNVQLEAVGLFSIKWELFDTASGQLMSLLLRVLIAAAGGKAYYVSPESARKLALALKSGGVFRHTLGSAVIEQDSYEIRIWRENRNLQVVALNSDMPRKIAWDGRIVYNFNQDHLDQNLVMAPLGLAGVQCVEEKLGARMKCSSRKALRSQPALFRGEEPVYLPFAPWTAPGFVPPDWQHWTPALEKFQSHSDRVLACAIRKLR
jgi:tRNA(Ile)-lysidine synthase